MAAAVSSQTRWQRALQSSANVAALAEAPRVGSIVRHHLVLTCPATSTLLDVADLLIKHDRTAVLVGSGRGELAGVITENDIMRAFSTGVPSYLGVITWLDGGHARLPRSSVGVWAVEEAASLKDAAAQMCSESSSDHAQHHLVVKGEKGDSCGVLSSMDLVRAMCSLGAHQGLFFKVGGVPVSSVMKPRAALPLCSRTATLSQVFMHMVAGWQNLVLIAESDEDSSAIVGVITPRDAARAFAEHISGTIEVGHYLRGLQREWESRRVRADAHLSEIASIMAVGSLHHLVVISPDDAEVVGVVSSLDLVHVIAAA